MTSRIEQLIDELEDFIDQCKYQPFSNTKIIVDKDKIEEIISDLKTKTPEELKKYQKVVSNQQAILKDAKEKAEALINDAAAQTHEMINQNSIMQQAYAQADQVVKSAYQQAREILDSATTEANDLKNAAVEYMDGMLEAYENIVGQTLNLSRSHYESFYTQLNQYYETVVANRSEIRPPSIETTELPLEYINLEDTGSIQADVNTGSIPSEVQTGNSAAQVNNASVSASAVASAGSKSDGVKIDMM